MKPGSLSGSLLCVCLIIAGGLACVSASSSGQTSPPDSLTLEQAVRLTLSNHPAVTQAQEGVVAADARIEATRSPYYPDVSLSGTYGRIGPVPTIDIPHVPPAKLFPENNYDVHLGVREILYDFGKTAASVELARSGRQAADDYVDQVKSNLAYGTISVFYSILILRQSVFVLDEQIEALNQHLEITRKKVSAGTATDFDVLTTQVRTAAARNERVDAVNALETQEILFRQLTGIPQEQPVRLRGDFSRVAVALDYDSLLKAALRQRPEITMSRNAETSAGLQLRLSSLGDKPSLALNLTSGFKNGYVPDLNDLKANFYAGVQFQYPIFNGNQTRHRENEAEANLVSARSRTRDLEGQIAADVRRAMAGVDASLEKIQNADVQVRQAEEAVSLARTRYEAGVITNLDLLDIQTTLTQARLNRLRTFHALTANLVALDRAVGKKVW